MKRYHPPRPDSLVPLCQSFCPWQGTFRKICAGSLIYGVGSITPPRSILHLSLFIIAYTYVFLFPFKFRLFYENSRSGNWNANALDRPELWKSGSERGRKEITLQAVSRHPPILRINHFISRSWLCNYPYSVICTAHNLSGIFPGPQAPKSIISSTKKK